MSRKIAAGHRVTLRCCVSDATGAVLDDGSRPLVFVCGRQQILGLLEAALVGKEPGHSCRVELQPEQAYGLYRPELVFEAVRDNLPQGLDIQVGMDLSPGGTDGKFNLKVLALTERGAMLDGNHRYAGKYLVFNIEVVNVEPEAEVSNA